MRKKIAQSTRGSGEILAAYVAFLRSLYLIHQNHHWQCANHNFYGNHLMFERLYKDVAEQADAMAEKTIGLFGNHTLDLAKQANLIKAITTRYAGDGSAEECLKQSLQAELEFIKASENVKNRLEENQELSLGLDDLIMELASKSEARVYLLKQANEITS